MQESSVKVEPGNREQADELLAVRCQLGERAAFDDLIHRWSDPLRRYVLRVTGDTDAADDLVQEIWVRVLQGMGRLRECARFRSWLFGIAHRTLMDRLRAQYAMPVDRYADPAEIALEDPAIEHEALQRDIERGLRLMPVAEREVLSRIAARRAGDEHRDRFAVGDRTGASAAG
ncbi:MAG: sigma-70 family RNA polymerase sigma factor [Gammaproteobacteria bacterium]|nr:sigma-70 family RNA polymerase sigma factor [Gammaproteobacteria bacterium]